MPVLNLKYGHQLVPFEYDAERFDILGSEQHQPTLSDAEIERIGRLVKDQVLQLSASGSTERRPA